MSEEIMSGDSSVAAAQPMHNSYESNPGSGGEQHVPLSALQQERSSRQAMEEQLRVIKDHLSLLQANQQRPSAPAPKDDFDGLSDNDVMTVGEFKRVASKMQQNIQMNVEELRMTQKYPDYQEVVTKFLPDVLNTNPSLRRSLETTNDYELAYFLAKNSENYKVTNKTQKRNSDAERILANSTQSGSLSAVGGTTPVSQAKRYKAMTDDEFNKEVAKNTGRF